MTPVIHYYCPLNYSQNTPRIGLHILSGCNVMAALNYSILSSQSSFARESNNSLLARSSLYCAKSLRSIGMGPKKYFKRCALFCAVGILVLEYQKKDSRLGSTYRISFSCGRQVVVATGNASLASTTRHGPNVDELFHSSHLEYLPLQDWELQSAGPERRCEPPNGIPSYCCLGSASEGGEVKYKSDRCLNNNETDMLHPYRNVQNLSLHWLNQHPLPADAARKCDTCQIVQTLLEHNLTLAFVGDSLIRQIATGLECDLRRRNYNVSVVFEEQPEIDPRWRYRWVSSHHMTVSRGNQQTVIRFFNMYRPNAGEEGLPKILQAYPIDVLMFDHGLHYQTLERGEFMEDSLPALRVLAGKVPLLIWKETTSQHYDNPGGHFSWSVLGKQTTCVDIPTSEQMNQPSTAQWMKQLVRHLSWTLLDTSAPDFASKPHFLGQQELVMIPFRLFTSTLWNLHPGHPDCSHFCSTPYLWVPIWRSLRIAIDRALRNGQLKTLVDA